MCLSFFYLGLCPWFSAQIDELGNAWIAGHTFSSLDGQVNAGGDGDGTGTGEMRRNLQLAGGLEAVFSPISWEMLGISYFQLEFQDPKMQVLHHVRPYYVGISPYIGLT